MKKSKQKIFIFLLFALLLPTASAVPEIFNVQGRLTNDANEVVTGSYDFKFYIWNDATDGTLLWSEEHDSQAVNNGLFNVIIGDTNTSKSFNEMDFNTEKWLEIEVETEVQAPRLKMASIGTAMRAQIANDLNSTGDANTFNIGVSENAFVNNLFVSGDSNFANVEAVNLFGNLDWSFIQNETWISSYLDTTCDNNADCTSWADARFNLLTDSNNASRLSYTVIADPPWTTGGVSWAGLDVLTPWADANVADDITLTNITQITNRSYTDLSDLPTILPDSTCDNNAGCTSWADGRYNLLTDSNNASRLGYAVIADPPWLTGGVTWAGLDLLTPWDDANVADDITLTNITQITNRSYTDLSDLPTILPDTTCDNNADCTTWADGRYEAAFDVVPDTTLDANLTAQEWFYSHDSNANTECDGNAVLTGDGTCLGVTGFHTGLTELTADTTIDTNASAQEWFYSHDTNWSTSWSVFDTNLASYYLKIVDQIPDTTCDNNADCTTWADARYASISTADTNAQTACASGQLLDGDGACKAYANWDTAFGWGDHSLIGYLTSYTSYPNVLPWADANVANDITLDNLTQITTRNYSDLTGLPYLVTEADIDNNAMAWDTNTQTACDNNTVATGAGDCIDISDFYIRGTGTTTADTTLDTNATANTSWLGKSHAFTTDQNFTGIGLTNLFATTLFGNLNWSYLTSKPYIPTETDIDANAIGTCTAWFPITDANVADDITLTNITQITNRLFSDITTRNFSLLTLDNNAQFDARYVQPANIKPDTTCDTNTAGCSTYYNKTDINASFVPYVGADYDIDLGAHDLKATDLNITDIGLAGNLYIGGFKIDHNGTHLRIGK